MTEPDSTRSAMVDHNYHWRPIDSSTPRGVKLQLINSHAGTATYGRLATDAGFWTHWAPLPTFVHDDAGRDEKLEAARVSRLLGMMKQADELRKAKLRVRLGPGVCLECEGEGEQGGQFTGGTWPCDSCGGTGKETP